MIMVTLKTKQFKAHSLSQQGEIEQEEIKIKKEKKEQRLSFKIKISTSREIQLEIELILEGFIQVKRIQQLKEKS